MSQRPLTLAERNAARMVFGSSLDLAKIVVKESSAMTVPDGKYFRTWSNTVYVPPGWLDKIDTWTVIHELTHCWQYKRGIGFQVIVGAIRGEYPYGEEKGLKDALKAGKRFTDFNTEQQGDILADYYERRVSGKNVDAWQPFVHEVQQAKSEDPYPW